MPSILSFESSAKTKRPMHELVILWAILFTCILPHEDHEKVAIPKCDSRKSETSIYSSSSCFFYNQIAQPGFCLLLGFTLPLVLRYPIDRYCRSLSLSLSLLCSALWLSAEGQPRWYSIYQFYLPCPLLCCYSFKNALYCPRIVSSEKSLFSFFVVLDASIMNDSGTWPLSSPLFTSRICPLLYRAFLWPCCITDNSIEPWSAWCAQEDGLQA